MRLGERITQRHLAVVATLLSVLTASTSRGDIELESNQHARLRITNPDGTSDVVEPNKELVITADKFMVTNIGLHDGTVTLGEEDGADYRIRLVRSQRVDVDFIGRTIHVAQDQGVDVVVAIIEDADNPMVVEHRLRQGQILRMLDDDVLPQPQLPAIVNQSWSLRLASWNLLNLSRKKVCQNPNADGTCDPAHVRDNLLENMARIIGDYHVVFVQEILHLEAWQQLCAKLPTDYDCLVSNAKGRPLLNRRTEYYGVAYRYPLTVQIGMDFQNPTGMDPWERPPTLFRVALPVAGEPDYVLDVLDIHTKPMYAAADTNPDHRPRSASVHNELVALQAAAEAWSLTTGGGNVLVLGDLNADCSAYPVMYRADVAPAGAFPCHPDPLTGRCQQWRWRIGYGAKTNTAAGSACAYDRFILNVDAEREAIEHGIFSGDPPQKVIDGQRIDGKRVSDHYLIWLKLGRGAVATFDAGNDSRRRFAELQTCNLHESVYAQGSGLPPGSVFLDVVGHPIADGDTLAHSIVHSQQVADGHGVLPPAFAAAAGLQAGLYNVVIDVDRDGVYQQQSDPKAVFLVEPCNPKKRKRTVSIVNAAGATTKKLNAAAAASEAFSVVLGGLQPNQTATTFVVSHTLVADSEDEIDWDLALEPYLDDVDVLALRKRVSADPEGNVVFVLPFGAIELDERFLATYGTRFSIVVDLDGDLRYRPGRDFVDATTTGRLEAYFAARPDGILAAGDHGAAVVDYKRFLNDKLGLVAPLDELDERFDDETSEASEDYWGDGALTA